MMLKHILQPDIPKKKGRGSVIYKTGGDSCYGYQRNWWKNTWICLLFSVYPVFVAMGLSYVVGCCVNTFNALNGIVNVLGLGMSFLGGVFVDVSLMSKGVRYVAQFIPVYWYESANELLGQYDVLPAQIQTQIWKSIGIQMIFAIALFCAGMVITRMRSQEE